MIRNLSMVRLRDLPSTALFVLTRFSLECRSVKLAKEWCKMTPSNVGSFTVCDTTGWSHALCAGERKTDFL